VTGEIFPLKIRAKAMSLSMASIWLWNFVISFASESASRLPVRVLAHPHPILQFDSTLHG